MLQDGFDVTWGEAKLVNFNILDFAQAMPIIMFAFTCQVNVFSIYDELGMYPLPLSHTNTGFRLKKQH